MSELDRPPYILPQYRGGTRPSYIRQNQLVDSINRSNTGVAPPYQLEPDLPANTGLLNNISITIDGGGSNIASGSPSLGGATVELPYDCTILSWTVEADVSGSIAIDVTRAVKAVPSTSIVGSGNKPTLSSQQYASALVSGWTSVALAQGDIIGFALSGTPATCTRVTVTLRVAC